ncbi:Rieske 2Fe-2S domain-containing protein [Marinibaculum pumilum]|uniref:Rieske 2Fe-2S domain-containing protein n=1 Tax=Marinibaculum pumilum TaxID=1766165 RepID=A0ABV7KYC0_9PROT
MTLAPDSLHPDVAAVLDGLADSAQPVETARVLPPEAYGSPAFHEFEKAAVFRRSWLCVGRVQQLPEAGDYFAVTIADEPLLVVRGDDGAVRAMSALCRHRGHPLKESCSGNEKRFVCPYHRWTYGRDGSFVGAPHMKKVISQRALAAESALPQLKVEIWQGFIFVNFDDAAEPLAPTLTKLDPYLENYDLDAMVTIPPRFDPEPGPWNWKMLLENYIEPYHTEFVHPVIHDFAPSTGVQFDPWSDGDNVIVRSVPFRAADGGLTEHGWAAPAAFPVIEGLNETQRNRVGFGMIPPTMNIIFTPDMLCYGLVYPAGPTGFTVGGGLFTAGGWCVPKATAGLPDFDARAARLMEGSRQLGAQDTTVNLAMQRAKASVFAPRGRYSHLEETLSQFNRWLAVKYRAEAGRRGWSAPVPGMPAGVAAGD